MTRSKTGAMGWSVSNFGAMRFAVDELLIISGSMGSGKTTVLFEASDILASRDVAHAAIDLDALGVAYFESGVKNNEVMYRNLRSVCENYARAGLKRVLLAGAMEKRHELERCREAVSAKKATVCRLIASVETMEARVQSRDCGMFQERYVARVAELNGLVEKAQLEDFTVVNEGRAVTEVAKELLTRAGWI